MASRSIKGLREHDLPEAVKRVLSVAPESNPVPATEDNITALLTNALAGTVPVPTVLATR